MNQTLDAPLDVKALADNGAFEGLASVFDIVDQMQERVAPGAFRKSLAEHARKGRMPALLWQHDTKEPLGAWREIKETDDGLFVKGELFTKDIPRARQAHALLKGGGLTGLSIGFRLKDHTTDRKTGVRTLTRIDLFEVSLVTFPALDVARVSRVKAEDITDARTFEAALRDELGFSNRAAKRLVAGGWPALSDRDDREDEVKKLVASLKRAASILDSHERT